ncbi:GNAT family N-acetyltransferase [Bradyrhizobium sp. LHD-71]|uniref:GNAT family N-acetyltransferase n=1 Tax=Bradyrhizobium sp. LHD-71 TaxID=3072141 RepID=UPI00280D7FC1|nr:GNAT family N-acetyltransferase [Bradyrhizobium sp. LHD-71]MDQ8727149.1 GNAT family N-acetyltransferase [Bradyrhizobium sp. LHD-71]
MTVRFVEPSDIEPLRRYFGGLSSQSHYNRFLGATRGVPPSEFERMLRTGEAHHFAVLAEFGAADARTIIGEARYALDPQAQAVEVGISVADDWHGHGVGSALLANLECRAVAIGAAVIFGDALPTNREMLGLARRRGYRLTHPPGDWKLVRFTRDIRIAQDVPCARSSRAVPLLAAAG